MSVSLSVRLSVYHICPSASTLMVAFLHWFSLKFTVVTTPKSKSEFIRGQYRTIPSPILPPKTPILGQEVLKIHANIKYHNPISALNVCESPKFSRLLRNRVRGTRWWRRILDRKWKYSRFAYPQWKICSITLIYGWLAKISASYRKSGSRITTVTSDFRWKWKCIRFMHVSCIRP